MLETPDNARRETRAVSQAFPALSVQVVGRSDGQRLVVGGEIDLASAPLLEARLHAVTSTKPVTIDLSAVTFIDCTGLRALSDAHEMLGDRLQIIPSPCCERLFELVGAQLPLIH